MQLVAVLDHVPERGAARALADEDDALADGQLVEPLGVDALAFRETGEGGDALLGEAGRCDVPGGRVVRAGAVAVVDERAGRLGEAFDGDRVGGRREHLREEHLRGARGGVLARDAAGDGALEHALGEEEHEERDGEHDDGERERGAEQAVLDALDAEVPGLAEGHDVLLAHVDVPDGFRRGAHGGMLNAEC